MSDSSQNSEQNQNQGQSQNPNQGQSQNSGSPQTSSSTLTSGSPQTSGSIANPTAGSGTASSQNQNQGDPQRANEKKDGNQIVIASHFLARLLSRGGEAELLSAADRLDIMDLVSTFGWCIDARSYEVLANIIVENFVMDLATEKIEGRDKFIEFLKNGKHYDGLRHQNTNILMRSIDLTNAVAVSHLSLIKVGEGEGKAEGMPCIVIQAVCTDVLKSEKDIWKIAKRTLDQMSVNTGFVTDAGAREKFAMTAKDRRAAAKPASK